MRRSISLFMLVMLMAGIGFSSASFTAAQGTGTTQNYVVQYGDTLWDLAGTYLGNAYQWREIHQENPFIADPNLIYPGDVLQISSALAGGAPSEQPAGQSAGKRSAKQLARPWYGVPAPAPEEVARAARRYPIVASNDFIEAVGYITPYTMQKLAAAQYGQISGVEYQQGETYAQLIQAEAPRPGLVFGDIVYINRGSDQAIREGDMFVAFSPVSEVRHPLTSEVIGTQITILGRLRVKTVEPNVACAEIVKSYNYMEIGDPLMSASELSLPLQKPLAGNSRSYGFQVGNQLIAHILSERIGHKGISEGDIVFIDVGAAQGVQPADNFIVFREVGKGFPNQAIGRLSILSVQEQTATALVTESVKPIDIGEKAVLMR